MRNVRMILKQAPHEYTPFVCTFVKHKKITLVTVHSVPHDRCVVEHYAGRMFWFTRKKLVGSYFFLIAASRS